jgi:thymidine kinase
MHRFTLHLVCANCGRRSMRELDASGEPDPPTSVDDLVDCGALNRMTFACKACDCPCGELVAIDVVRPTVSQAACA